MPVPLPISVDPIKTKVLPPETFVAKAALLSRSEFFMKALLRAPPAPCILKPPPVPAVALPLLIIRQSSIKTRALAVPSRSTPFWLKFRMEHLRIVVFPAPVTLTPLRPVPSPSISSPSSKTLSVAFGTFTMMALVPDTSTPASMWSEMMLIAFVMVTPPKPPGSRTLISPPGAVLEIAPAKVLHGAVRLHGLASSPTPDTHVRVACAKAGTLGNQRLRVAPRRPATTRLLRIVFSSLSATYNLSLKCITKPSIRQGNSNARAKLAIRRALMVTRESVPREALGQRLEGNLELGVLPRRGGSPPGRLHRWTGGIAVGLVFRRGPDLVTSLTVVGYGIASIRTDFSSAECRVRAPAHLQDRCCAR